jgi:hypothetical protein
MIDRWSRSRAVLIPWVVVPGVGARLAGIGGVGTVGPVKAVLLPEESEPTVIEIRDAAPGFPA